MLGHGIVTRGFENGVREIPRAFGMGIAGGIWGWVVLSVILLAVIGLIVWGVIHSTKKHQAAVLEPLRAKYVDGKITEEEYLAKKSVLLKK